MDLYELSGDIFVGNIIQAFDPVIIIHENTIGRNHPKYRNEIECDFGYCSQVGIFGTENIL